MLMGWIGRQLTLLHGHDFPAAMLAFLLLITVVAAMWAALVGALASAPALRGVAVALTPPLLRGVLFAGFAGALTVPAHADDRGLDGLRLPDRPLVTPTPAAPEPGPVVVRRGDTLWAIAAGALGPGPGNAATARACARWHSTNRDVIGPDADLIHPGQRLTPPKDQS
jgi:nucleoid-associated protein YgaU